MVQAEREVSQADAALFAYAEELEQERLEEDEEVSPEAAAAVADITPAEFRKAKFNGVHRT